MKKFEYPEIEVVEVVSETVMEGIGGSWELGELG